MSEADAPSRKRLTPTVWRLGWVSLFNDVASDMSYPLLPAFLATMGAAGMWLGLVEGVAESVGAVVKYYAGAASDRAPVRKPFVVIGYGLSSIVRPVLALAVAPWQVIALRSSDRIAKGVRSAPRDAILAASIAPEARAYAFAFHRMMDNLGAVIGPLAAFLLARLAHLSPRAIFACTIVPGILVVATLLFGVHESAPPKQKKAQEEKRAPVGPHVKRYLTAVAVFSLGASADSFLLLRLSKQGLADALLPIAWLSLNAMKALTNLPGGALADRIGHKPTLLGGWVLYTVAYAAFPFAQTVMATWLVMLGYGFYYGLTEGAEKAFLAVLAPQDQRGRAFGLLHAITGAAVLPANAVFGALFDAHPSAAFFMGAAFAGAGALMLAFVPAPITYDRAA